jgi:pSer/pThr/pTyr-binding forkhead associated (FHA) protein
MLAILKIQGDASDGRKIWLTSGEAIRIGRTEQADVALPLDRNLSSIHFLLTCSNSQCTAKAVNGATLRLNGREIQESVLRSGDVLQAGGTRFVVSIEGAVDTPTRDEVVAEPVDSLDPPPDVARSVRCEVERTTGGAYLYRFPGDAQLVHATLTDLKVSGFVHVIADRQSRWRDERPSRATLFDWLSDRLTDASPEVVFDVDSCDVTIVEHSIADRERTFVMARVTGDELLEHLRLAARGQVRRDEQPDAERMLLSFDAARLDDVLPRCDPHYIEFLFSKLTAVLYWSDDVSTWTIASGKRLGVVANTGICDYPLPGDQPLATITLEGTVSQDGMTC